MHVGGDYHSVAGSGITGSENLEYSLRCGVKHLTAQIRKRGADGGWDAGEMKRMRDDCDKLGVTLEAIRMDADYISIEGRGPRSGARHDPAQHRKSRAGRASASSPITGR